MLMSGAAPTGASTCAIRRHAGPRTRKALLSTISTRHLVCPGDHDAGLWIYSLIISGASGSAASVVEKQRRARSGLPEGVVETSRWQGGVTKMHGKLALFWLFSSSPPITHPPAVRLQRLRRHTRTRGFCVGFDTVDREKHTKKTFAYVCVRVCIRTEMEAAINRAVRSLIVLEQLTARTVLGPDFQSNDSMYSRPARQTLSRHMWSHIVCRVFSVLVQIRALA